MIVSHVDILNFSYNSVLEIWNIIENNSYLSIAHCESIKQLKLLF